MRYQKRCASFPFLLLAAILAFHGTAQAATGDPCREVYYAGYSSERYFITWGNGLRKAEAEALANAACYEDRVTAGDLSVERDLYIAQCFSRGERCVARVSYDFDIDCEAATCSGSHQNGWMCHYSNAVKLTVRCMDFEQYLREISSADEALGNVS